MDNQLPDTIAGASTWALIWGFVGSVCSLRYTPPMSFGQAIIAVITGMTFGTCAAMLTLNFVHSIPPVLGLPLAYLYGLFAMRLIPALMDAAVDNIKRLKFPWSKE